MTAAHAVVTKCMTDQELFRAADIASPGDEVCITAADLRNVATFAIERYIAVEQLPLTQRQLSEAIKALEGSR